MEIFLELLIKLLPLYCLIIFGYLAGRLLEVNKESVATLVIYVVTPVVVFRGVSQTEISFAVVMLPILFFFLCAITGLGFYRIGKYFWRDGTANILGFAAAAGNCGYFGIPVSVLFFGEESLGIAALCVLGNSLFENTIGVFTIAQGKFSAREALLKVLKLPTLYAFLFGLTASLLELSFAPPVHDMMEKFTGAYTVLGMMIIGLSLTTIREVSFDFRFFSLTFLAKFLVWPAISLTVLSLDQVFFQWFVGTTGSVILLMSIVPVAANTAAWAAIFGLHPEKTAVSVLGTTLFALVYIPLFVQLFV